MARSYGSRTATLLADGRVLVVGDMSNASVPAAADLFDPGTGRWTATGSMAMAGVSTATLLPDGRVLVTGAYKGDWAVAELYDPRNSRWTATGSMAAARQGHTATLLADGRVLVLGGFSVGAEFMTSLSDAEVYDPGTGRWTPTGSLATARAGHTATLLADGRVLVAGGSADVFSGDGSILTSAELYDPGSGRWTATGSMADPRTAFAATLLADGRVLVAGGRYSSVAEHGLTSAELYDPGNGRWTATGSMTYGRQNGHTATLLTDGRVLVVGNDYTRSAEVYDPMRGQWVVTARTLEVRGGTATLLPDGRVLVVGGEFAELYDPNGSPAPAATTLPVRRSARVIGLDIGMAPGPNGALFVSIPGADGSMVVLLDRSGRPRPGWPVVIKDYTSCFLLLPVDDGSVRVVCDATDLPQSDVVSAGVRAFAFDAGGRSMAGWPVGLGPAIGAGPVQPYPGRVVGDQLTLFVTLFVNRFVSSMTTIAADGSIRHGTDVPETCCGINWSVGPDGIAYGVESASGRDRASAEVSRITALGPDGIRAGWPVMIDGVASVPAFGPLGRIVLTVGSFVRNTSRILAFDRDGKAVSARSKELPIETVEASIDCGMPMVAPIVGQDGTIFVYSAIDTPVFALDSSLDVMPGWPFEPAAPLEAPNPWRNYGGLNCPSLAFPAVGPEGILYLPLRGGNIVAVGLDGRVRPGWPVELRRPGAEFWSVVVGPDGTAYALAIEPETGGASSATVLAIAQDSTVLYTTTIIDP